MCLFLTRERVLNFEIYRPCFESWSHETLTQHVVQSIRFHLFLYHATCPHKKNLCVFPNSCGLSTWTPFLGKPNHGFFFITEHGSWHWPVWDWTHLLAPCSPLPWLCRKGCNYRKYADVTPRWHLPAEGSASLVWPLLRMSATYCWMPRDLWHLYIIGSWKLDVK